ncbi:MAG TPA: GNAT family N-acetyltransferase [Candidatus Dormibacteraeota bacterium]|nr:GNAT family N-acetyltransferase [Candidatus Dormibacteraeota bacterium]
MRLFRPQPRIALAAAAEADAIAALCRRAWEPFRGRIDERVIVDQVPSADEVTTWLTGGFELFTATLDGELAGVIRCSFPTGTCFADRLAVAPERSGDGVGRALAEHAIARARRAGVTKVWVQAPTKLEEYVQLYRSLGFRESAHLRAHQWEEDVTLLELHL